MSQERPLTDLEAFHRDALDLHNAVHLVERGVTYGILEPAALDDLCRAFLNVAFRGEIELLDSPQKTLQEVAGEVTRAHLVRMSHCFEAGAHPRN